MAWMWSYEYIAQTTGKDAGKNRGDLLQVTSFSEFVGLGDPGTSCSSGGPPGSDVLCLQLPHS